MMRVLLLYLVFVNSIWSFCQEFEGIDLHQNELGKSYAQEVYFYEDVYHELTVNDILEKPLEKFYQIPGENQTKRYSRSLFWIKFEVTNKTSFEQFILETARPITDTVVFYEIVNKQVTRSLRGGDGYPVRMRTVKHQKNIFPFTLEPHETKTFILKIGSGGEGLLFPVIIDEETAFYEKDVVYQFLNGSYYGIVAIVIVIFFFFFMILRELSFLYYILYVLAQGLMQFSVDGYFYRYLLSSSSYWVNRIPVMIGLTSVVFMLVYIGRFLNLKTIRPKIYNLYKVWAVIIIISYLFALSTGSLHVLSFPIINLIGLLSSFMAIGTIFYLTLQKVKIDIYFLAAFGVYFIGVSIFVLGNLNAINNMSVTLHVLKVTSVLEIGILSISMSNIYRKMQEEKEVAQRNAVESLRERNILMNNINARLESEVKERTTEILAQKEELIIINKEIISSIKYAKKIQEAILPDIENIQQLLPQSFVLYLPKDVVSGDFYFFDVANKKGEVVFAAVDCTGHGVPGAFMSIVGSDLLNQAIKENSFNSPAEALNFLNEGIHKTLSHTDDGDTMRDGMDMALCLVNLKQKKLSYAGAKNPLYIVRRKINGEILSEPPHDNKFESDFVCLFEIKADHQPIGNAVDGVMMEYTNHEIALQEGDHIYIFSDGFADQFGGPRSKKFSYARFRNLLIDINGLSPSKQKEKLHATFNDWKRGQEQIDDVLVVGVVV